MYTCTAISAGRNGMDVHHILQYNILGGPHLGQSDDDLYNYDLRCGSGLSTVNHVKYCNTRINSNNIYFTAETRPIYVED
jgi:hypothetical protein